MAKMGWSVWKLSKFCFIYSFLKKIALGASKTIYAHTVHYDILIVVLRIPCSKSIVRIKDRIFLVKSQLTNMIFLVKIIYDFGFYF